LHNNITLDFYLFCTFRNLKFVSSNIFEMKPHFENDRNFLCPSMDQNIVFLFCLLRVYCCYLDGHPDLPVHTRISCVKLYNRNIFKYEYLRTPNISHNRSSNSLCKSKENRYCPLGPNVCNVIQAVHKRMVQFQKLTRNLFLTLHGRNKHHQQRHLSKFLMRYEQFDSNA
jgi:hypothetical protein